MPGLAYCRPARICKEHSPSCFFCLSSTLSTATSPEVANLIGRGEKGGREGREGRGGERRGERGRERKSNEPSVFSEKQQCTSPGILYKSCDGSNASATSAIPFDDEYYKHRKKEMSQSCKG